jgi:hypothetical protein
VPLVGKLTTIRIGRRAAMRKGVPLITMAISAVPGVTVAIAVPL